MYLNHSLRASPAWAIILIKKHIQIAISICHKISQKLARKDGSRLVAWWVESPGVPLMHSNHYEPSMQRKIDQCYLRWNGASTTCPDPISNRGHPSHIHNLHICAYSMGKIGSISLCFLHEPTILIGCQCNLGKGVLHISESKEILIWGRLSCIRAGT